MKHAQRFLGIFATLVFAMLLSGNCFPAWAQSHSNANADDNSAPANTAPTVPVPDERGIYKVGGPVSAPKLTRVVDPEYSKQAEHDKLQGVCIVELVVDSQGMPRDIRIAQPLGKGLDENAIKAIRQYRFQPAKLNGKPVPVEIRVEVNFRNK